MRNTKTIEIKDSLFEGTEKTFGRDIGKVFRLKEMSAMELEKWHAKAISFMIDNADLSGLNDISEKVKQEQKENGATLAFDTAVEKLGATSIKNIDAWLDIQNEHLYCYEYFDKLKDSYIQLNALNIGDYIDELETLRYLREQAISFNCKESFTKGNR